MSTDLRFTPVPVRPRRDGWTPLRQTMFVLALAERRCVVAAATVVGMSWQTAYRLRARSDAASFAAAWDRALAPPPVPRNSGSAVDGVATPIRYRGRQVGERRRHDNRLAMYLLRIRRPDRYGDGLRAVARRDPAEAAAHALAVLEADLAAGTAPCDGGDCRADVARTSSPSAPDAAPFAPAHDRAKRPARHGDGARAKHRVSRQGRAPPATPPPRAGANKRGRSGCLALPRSRERLRDLTWRT